MKKIDEIVLVAKSLLSNDIGIIEASRKLVKLQYETELENEENLKIFWVIDSETDHLPIGERRLNLSDESLVKYDKEMEECESFYKDDVVTACKNIIKKYDK
ncbi:MAG: DUF2489 domain-containing protein [Pyrinomonadaceae bacterium]|nr:DUF2489 domain-containing protein [Pyrinomonadaceae bacterium]